MDEDEEGEEGDNNPLSKFDQEVNAIFVALLDARTNPDITKRAPYKAFLQYQVLVYREKDIDLADERSQILIGNIARVTLVSKEEQDLRKAIAAAKKELKQLEEEQEEQEVEDNDDYFGPLVESKKETIAALELATKISGKNRVKSGNLVFAICKLCKDVLDENKKMKHMIRMESLMDRLSAETSEALKLDKAKGDTARYKTTKANAEKDTKKKQAIDAQEKLRRLEKRMKLNKEVTNAEDALFKKAQQMKLDKIGQKEQQQTLTEQNDEIKSQTQAMKNERIKENAIKEKQREEQQREVDARKQMNKSKALENAKLREELKTEKLKQDEANLLKKRTQAGNTSTAAAAAGSSSSSSTPPYNTTVLSNTASSSTYSSSSKIQYLVTTTGGGTPSISGKKLSQLLEELNQIPEYKTLKTSNHCLKVIDSLLKEKSFPTAS